jgi:hypothetical protein
MRAFTSGVQRWATVSPAKWITASAPRTAPGGKRAIKSAAKKSA